MDPIVQPFIHKANKPETSSRLNPRAAEFTPFSQDPSTSFDLGTPSHSREPSLSSATTLSSSTTLVEQPPPIVSSASRQLPIIANTNQQPFMVTNPSWQRPFVNNAYWPWPYCPPAQYYTPYGPSPWNTPDYIKSSTPTDSGRPEHPAPVSEPPESTKRGRTGWPINHTPLQNSSYNSLHPSKIPDSAFFEGEQSNNSMAMEDPWKSGSFDPAATPWWTHWTIATANTITNMNASDICKLYKWRYRDVIHGINNMTPSDEMLLWKHLKQMEDRYAFACEEGDEYRLGGLVRHYLKFAQQGTAKEEGAAKAKARRKYALGK